MTNLAPILSILKLMMPGRIVNTIPLRNIIWNAVVFDLSTSQCKLDSYNLKTIVNCNGYFQIVYHAEDSRFRGDIITGF